jgi:CMP-N,N'-diacetyllegionaminic acid synthase
MKKKIICIILARGGSKGLKNKNLRKVSGRPLIYYPIRDALDTKIMDDIIVSTDDTQIAKCAKKYGAKVPFVRPKKLSGDFATTESCLKHALLYYEKIKKIKYDYGVFIGATDIFRDINWIIDGVRILNKNKKIESVFSGHITHKNYWEKKNNRWVRLRSWMSKYSSRQIRRKIIREDTALACVSRADLWRKGKRIGDNVEIIQNQDPFTALEIHDLQDLKLVNAAYKLRFKK